MATPNSAVLRCPLIMLVTTAPPAALSMNSSPSGMCDDVAMVLEEIQMAPSEFGEVMRFTGLAADRAEKQAAAVGGNLQMQFVWLFAGLQTLIDQPPRRRHRKPQSQYRIRVHTRPAHLELRQWASVLVTLRHSGSWSSLR